MPKNPPALVGRALIGAGLALLLAFAPARAQDPCEDCPPDSKLIAEWRQMAARVTGSLAEQLDRGVLAVDLAGWVTRAEEVEAALAHPDSLAVFVTRGLGQQIVAYDSNDWDLVWIDSTGWDLVAYDDNGWDLVFSDRSGREMLGYDDNNWEMVAIDAGGGDPLAYDQNGWDLIAVLGLSQDQLKIDDTDWDLVAYDNNSWDLIAVVGAGEGLGNSDPTAWNSIAAAGAEQAWRDYNDAFDTWLPVH